MPIRHLAALRHFAVASAALALLGSANPSPAGARAPYVAPAYTLGFVDGVAPSVGLNGPELPDYASIFIDAPSPNSEAPVLQLLRGDTVIASKTTAPPNHQYASVNLAELRAGDVARVVMPSTGLVVTEAPFDALPRFEATTCGGSTVLAGVRRAGSRVHFVAVRRVESDGSEYAPGEGGDHQARITHGAESEPDDRIAGIFRYTLVAGQILSVQSSWWTGTTQVFNDIDAYVPPCPAALLPSPSPLPPPPSGSPLAPTDARAVLRPIKLKRGTRLADLTKRGLPVEITSDRDASLAMTLVVKWSTTTKGKRKKQSRSTIGTLQADLKAGKLAKLTLRADKKKLKLLRKLAKQRGSKLVVTATLAAVGGKARPLPSTTLKLPKS